MARKKLPYYSMYPSDFDTDENVRAMDDAELGFYVRCLNHAWINGSIPADLEEIGRIFGRPEKYVEKVWRRVGRCFVAKDGEPDRLVNPRQEEERACAGQKSEAARAKINKRWAKKRQQPYSGSTVVSDQYGPGNTLQNQNQNTPPVAPYELPEALVDAFHELRGRYPNATDVDFALQVWISLCDTGEITPDTLPEIFAGLERWLKSELWSRDSGRYITSLAKWLSAKRWKDDPMPSAEAKASSQVEYWKPYWKDEHGNIKPEYSSEGAECQ